jgi:hypothetical protein
MAKQSRQMEGDATQRRDAAREAREAGKLPSEAGATLGASKQRGGAKRNASHQERLEGNHTGKNAGSTSGDEARPGSRDRDPRRSDAGG